MHNNHIGCAIGATQQSAPGRLSVSQPGRPDFAEGVSGLVEFADEADALDEAGVEEASSGTGGAVDGRDQAEHDVILERLLADAGGSGGFTELDEFLCIFGSHRNGVIIVRAGVKTLREAAWRRGSSFGRRADAARVFRCCGRAGEVQS